MRDCMLDLETWGTLQGSAIRSIGAVPFDPYSDAEPTQAFYANVDDESQLALGLVKDQSTVDWWARQSQQAQNALLVDQRPIVEVVKKFVSFWQANRLERVWAQGSNFDPGLVEHIMRKMGCPVPWKFWNTRDTRTVYDIAGLNDKSIPRSGTFHNAKDDALHQIRCVRAAMKRLGR